MGYPNVYHRLSNPLKRSIQAAMPSLPFTASWSSHSSLHLRYHLTSALVTDEGTVTGDDSATSNISSRGGSPRVTEELS